jgi:hypothetical protein
MLIRIAGRMLVATMVVVSGGCQPVASESGRNDVGAGHATVAMAALRGPAATAVGAESGSRQAALPAGFHFAPEEVIRVGEVGEVNAAAVADIDGDHRNDVIVATGFVGTVGSGVSTSVVVFRQSGQGTLLPREQVDYLEHPITTPDLTTGDMDADGRADIIVGHSGISIIRYRPGAGYSTAVYYNQVCTHVVALDIDLDEALDVVCDGEGWLSVYYGDGRGGIRAKAAAWLGSYGWQDLKAADVTGDGLTDLVLFRDDDKSEVRVYPHASAGGFAAAVTYPFVDNVVADPAPWGMATGDFNGDGRTDLALSMTQSETAFHVMYQAADGALLPPQTYPSAYFPGEMAGADFDGDGDDDLVMRYPGWNLFAYFPQSAGGPGNEVDVTLINSWGGRPNNELVAGDVNGDHCQDVVMVDGYNLRIVKGIGCSHKPVRTGGPGQVLPAR